MTGKVTTAKFIPHILFYFNILFNLKYLEKDLKSELSGHFLDVVLGLLTPSDEYEAKILKKAIKVSQFRFILINSTKIIYLA